MFYMKLDVTNYETEILLTVNNWNYFSLDVKNAYETSVGDYAIKLLVSNEMSLMKCRLLS
jgi:hypothetical protein